MNKNLNVVLGGTKNVGFYVVEELRKRNLPVRIVARNKVNDKDFFAGDMSSYKDIEKALQDAKTVYVCSSFPYNTQVWKKQWPLFASNLVDIAKNRDIKIVYLDNTYLYGPPPLKNPISEEHQKNPTSKKGKIRKEITDYLIETATEKNIKLIIGRSANFVSPQFKTGLLYISFLEKMLIGKNPNYLGNAHVAQAFSYVPDVARALVELGESNYDKGEIFHLPVLDPLTPHQICELFNTSLNSNLEIKPLSLGMHKFLALFSPILKELVETRYQTDSTYILDDSKFRKTFASFVYTPTKEAYQNVVYSFIANQEK
jgi:nucleoside-diphosphate-sugar epimerase